MSLSSNPNSGEDFEGSIVPGMPVFQLATWHQRVGAGFVDLLFPWGISFVGVNVAKGQNDVLLQIFNIAAWSFIVWQFWMQGITGKTIGKRIARLKVVREEDVELVGGAKSLLRSLAHLIDMAACFIGLLWPIWDKKRQTFADKIFKTVVIHEGK